MKYIILKDTLKSKFIRKFLPVITFLLFMTQVYAHPYVCVKVRPVRPDVVAVHPACPGPRHIWIDGEWGWNPQLNNYIWNEGRWVIPQPYSKWMPGHWKQTYQGYYWMPGHWRRY